MRLKAGRSALSLALLTTALVAVVGATGIWRTHGSDGSRAYGNGDSAAPSIRETQPGLRRMASVSPRDAWTLVEGATGSNSPLAGRLTELGGKLVYVLYLRSTDGRVEEVIVDAGTGAIMSLPRRRVRSTAADQGG
jgi:hypothetical protein